MSSTSDVEMLPIEYDDEDVEMQDDLVKTQKQIANPFEQTPLQVKS